ncbi:MAG: hypothetical protein ACP5QO_11325 [Clostridia bacterium]
MDPLIVPGIFFGRVMMLATGLAMLEWPRMRALNAVVIPGQEKVGSRL